MSGESFNWFFPLGTKMSLGRLRFTLPRVLRICSSNIAPVSSIKRNASVLPTQEMKFGSVLNPFLVLFSAY